MGLWSDITSAIGSVFGGGNNSQPSSDPNDLLKRKQNNAPIATQHANLPSVYHQPSTVPLKAPVPIFNQQPATHSLVDSILHGATHNPVTNLVGDVAVKPFLGAAEGVGANAGSVISNAITGEHQTPEQAVQNTPLLRKVNTIATGQPADQQGVPYKNPDLTSPHELIPNLLMTATNLVAPGLDSLAEKGFAKLAPYASRVVAKYAPGAVTGGTLAGVYGGADAAQQGASPEQVLKSAAENVPIGAAAGVVLPAALNGVVKAIPALRGVLNRTTETADEGVPTLAEEATTPPESGTKGPTEVAPTNAPAGEPTRLVSVTPNTPESGIKPIEPTTPNVAKTPTAVPTAVAPPQTVATPANVAAEQAAAQQAVDKTAETVPQPVAAPETVAPNATPNQAASEAVAASPEQQVVNEAPNVPEYASPHKNGKASVPGNSQARYNTGDTNLDEIINDSLIAHKGTAATAGTRADALDKVGITAEQRAQIRNIATKNVDRNTGKISDSGVQQIKDVLGGPREAPSVPNETTPATPNETPETVAQSDRSIPQGSKLGTIARDFFNSGKTSTDADHSDLAQHIVGTFDQEAEKLGTSAEDLFQRVDTANRAGIKSLSKAGLSEDEANLYRDFLKEQSYLQDRGTLGNANRMGGETYVTRQKTGTEYDPSLVNEEHRTGGLTESKTDYSGQGQTDYLRRYADAPTNIANGIHQTLGEVGAELTPEGSSAVHEMAQEFTNTRDALDRDLSNGSVDLADHAQRVNAVKEADTNIRKAALNDLRSQPQTPATKEAIARLRKANGYMPSYIEANILSNPLSRIYDQMNKGLAVVTSKVDKVSKFVTRGSEQRNIGHSLEARSAGGKAAVKDLVKNTYNNGIKDQFNSNVALADGKLDKLSTTYKSGVGAAVQSADLNKLSYKQVIDFFASKAESEGITGKSAITKYVQDAMETPEFKDVHNIVKGVNNARIGLASHIDGSPGYIDRAATSVNNFARNVLDKTNLPPVAKDNIASALTRMTVGFPRVTATLAKNGANAVMVGFPRFVQAAKLINSGGELDAVRGAYMMRQAIQDAATGASMYGVGLALGAGGHWTGSYPTDKQTQAYWKAHGVQPNAFKFGDHYVQPERFLGGAALPLYLSASVGAHSGDPAAAAKEFVANVLSQSGAESTGNALNIAGGALTGNLSTTDSKNAKSDIGGILSSTVPMSGGLNAAGNATDKLSRDGTSSIQNSFLSKNPFTRQFVPAKTDTLGNPVANPDVAGSTVVTKGTTISGTKNSVQNAVSAEVERLNKAGYQSMPANAVKNTNSQNDAKLLINSDTYKSVDPKTQADMLHTVLDGTKTASISTKISNADRSALIQSTIMGKPKTAIWRENNDHDLSYVTAQIHNQKAQGTYNPMTDGDINKTGSLAQDLAVAKVNKQYNVSNDLKQNYADTDKTEFDKLSTDSPVYKALIAYDQQRIAAGLPSKYQNSQGGYGSGGSKNNLPSGNAVVMPSKGTGLTAASVKYAAPTLATAKVGASANNNPFVRSISTSKGVK